VSVKFRGPLPPDHPIFTIGSSFVFRSELPHEDEERDGHEDNQEDAED
jgi:hypothetical protein